LFEKANLIKDYFIIRSIKFINPQNIIPIKVKLKIKNMKYIKAMALMLCMACNNSNNNEETNDTIKDYDTGTYNPAESISSCYESINSKDTVFLSIFDKSKIITGSLNYNYYEKDKNSGTLRGNMYGDTLLAEYIFKTEGIISIRQVAFLKQGDSFIEGYGDVEEQYGKIVFKNRSALGFTGKVLHKVDCNDH
jgi:hypothetical protein